MGMYWAKYLLLYVGGWAFFVSFSARGFLSPGGRVFTDVAFPKAILWSIFTLGTSLLPLARRRDQTNDPR